MHQLTTTAPIVISLILATSVTRAAGPAFERKVVDDKISIGYGIAIGDVDGDKKPDILIADQSQIAWYRNGDWKRFVMAENLNPPDGARHRDNVCIAARDIDGDGKVEVAAGAQWNPGETTDAEKSGSVHYLVRPEDPTKRWQPIRLHHEPTVHRMHWVRSGEREYKLVVLPLHGRGNVNAAGAGVRVLAYDVPEDRENGGAWKTTLVDDSMHATHNFDIAAPSGSSKSESLVIGGKEGCKSFSYEAGKWVEQAPLPAIEQGLGEVRNEGQLIAGIRPMHGSDVLILDRTSAPKVIGTGLNQGHGLAIGDLLGLGRPQIIAGWRSPDKDKKVGIRLYAPKTADLRGDWESHPIDDNGMACEDLKLADLDGDGKQEIIAAGRATKNLVIYWNKNKP